MPGSPPGAPDRYFYFEDVTEQDSLFRYVARGVLDEEPTRENKAELLGRLRDRGVFLEACPIDVSGMLQEKLFARIPTCVLTSATLTVADSFGYMRARLGLSEADDEIVDADSVLKKNCFGNC